VVDYGSPGTLATVLAANDIETVISTMAIISEEQSQAQLDLIDAAIQAQTVKRFAPSHFGVDYVEAKKQWVYQPGSLLLCPPSNSLLY
jgi:3-keto-L-gulonate-6-phosphate decarboxylase